MSRSQDFLDRSAAWLAARSGSESRATELHDHLIDAAQNGDDISLGGLASLALLALRAWLPKMGIEVLRWFALMPIAALQLILLGLTYEIQFPAWDFVGPDEVVWTQEALMWNRFVNVVLVVSVIGTMLALRRALRAWLSGRFVLPALFIGLFVAAALNTGLFVERADWYRDHEQIYYALTAEHVNIIQPYSIALFTAFAAIPILYIIADVLNLRRNGVNGSRY